MNVGCDAPETAPGDPGIEMLMPAKTGIHRTSSSLQSKRRSSMRLYPFRRERHSPLRTYADAPERLPGPERIFCPADVDVEDRMVIGSVQHPAPQHPGTNIIRGIQPNTADVFRAFHSLQGRPIILPSSKLPLKLRVQIVPLVPYSSPSSAQRLRTFCVSSLLTVLTSGNSTPLNFEVASIAMRDVKPCLTSG